MNRELASGTFLIVGAASGVLVMALHPTGHDVMSSGPGGHMAHVNAMVHSLALVATPMVFFGLLGLARRLGAPVLGPAALIAYGWACVAVMSAAVVSGFITPSVMAHMSDPRGATLSADFVEYSALVNRGFAKVYVAASCVGLTLFAAAILRTGRLPRTVGVVGAVLMPLVLLLFLVGHLGLDIHGFGIIMFSQSGWLVWLGILLCRET